MHNTSNIFIPGKISFLLDAPAGSSGKGKLAAFITKHADNVHFLITSNSPNASHTVIDGNKNIVFKALPSGSLYHEKLDKVFIASGATFDVKSLLKEIELTGIPREKVRIHPRAGIATEIDAAYERGECDLDGNYFENRQDGTIKTGTTASGAGAVLAKKVLRHKTLKTAKDCPEIEDMIGIIEDEILELLKLGKSGFFEIGQGFPLSNNHWRFAPHTTSRNVTVSAALNDAMLPPKVVGNVVINTRTFPIRINSKKYVSRGQIIIVGGATGLGEPSPAAEAMMKKYTDAGFKCHLIDTRDNPAAPEQIELSGGKFLTWDEMKSGDFQFDEIDSYSGAWYPDQEEITWEKIEADADIQIPQVVKNTTLTKLPRRVATFSKINLDEAIRYNQTGNFVFISINFINFVDGKMEGVQDISKLSEKAQQWIGDNLTEIMVKHDNCILEFIGTSERTDDFITMPKPSYQPLEED